MYQRQVHRALAQPRKVGSSREERGQDQGTSEQFIKNLPRGASVNTFIQRQAKSRHWILWTHSTVAPPPNKRALAAHLRTTEGTLPSRNFICVFKNPKICQKVCGGGTPHKQDKPSLQSFPGASVYQ
ncbi:unnamed protein product [Eretmochelys imbricata]